MYLLLTLLVIPEGCEGGYLDGMVRKQQKPYPKITGIRLSSFTTIYLLRFTNFFLGCPILGGFSDSQISGLNKSG